MMIAHKNWVINTALSLIIAVACVVGDKIVQSMSEPLSKALVDNLTHAIVGLLSAIIVFTDQWDKIYLSIACLLMSSFIDADHFIAAKSLKLSVRRKSVVHCLID